MRFCCFEAFWGKFIEHFFLHIKVTTSETITEILRKFVFYHVYKWQILRKIWIGLNHCFWSHHWKGININNFPQDLLLNILLNYAFLLFWRIFFLIHRELLFFDIKVTLSETSTEILRKLVFLAMFERSKSWGKFGFV